MSRSALAALLAGLAIGALARWATTPIHPLPSAPLAEVQL